MPCLASGSRTAAVSMLAGILTVGLTRFKLLHIAWLVVSIPIVLHFFGNVQLQDELASQEVTQRLSEKGLEHTREELWQARLDEFKAHPWFGVGVGMAEGEGLEVSDAGYVNVEPGSSYLALLSMSGAAGAAAFAWLLYQVASGFIRRVPLLSRHELALTAGVATFMAIHGIGEGWLLAVGSPLAFVFWLCLGHMADLAALRNPETRTRSRVRLRGHRRMPLGQETLPATVPRTQDPVP